MSSAAAGTRIGLVLPREPTGRDDIFALVGEIERKLETHFVFLDPPLDLDLTKVKKLPNYSDIFFSEGRRRFWRGMSAL